MGPLDYSSVKDNFDVDSVKKIIGESKQVTVYGWSHCHYGAVSDALTRDLKVFDYRLGNDYESSETLERQKIEKMNVYTDSKSEKEFHRKCKIGISNLLLENYKRCKEGKEFIPLIFCIDTDNNEFITNSETISSKDQELNDKITHSELRHCYKLHCELAESPNIEFQQMSQIAKKMLKFVKVTRDGRKVVLQEVPALWDWPGLPKAMKERTEKATKAEIREDLCSKKWRVQLLSAAKKHDDLQKPVVPHLVQISTQKFTLKH